MKTSSHLPFESLTRIKLKWTLIFIFAYSFFYIFPNLYPLFPPLILPRFSIENTIPLLPWTFIIYLSDYALGFSTAALLDEPHRMHSLTRMVFMTLFICGTCFIFAPTTYPRPLYPESDFWLVKFDMFLVKHLDTPNNCFPSMHVALAGVATWSLRHKGPKIFIPYAIWSLAIFASTLTTKQHYLLDIIGGLAVVLTVAILDWALFEKGVFRPLADKEETKNSYNFNNLK